jgi:hypothetical protein
MIFMSFLLRFLICIYSKYELKNCTKYELFSIVDSCIVKARERGRERVERETRESEKGHERE